MRNNIQISYCIGIYNEEEIVSNSFKFLSKFLEKKLGKNNFEIVLVENGSTDKTYKVLKSIKSKNLTSLSIPRKGHGSALRHAIKNARYEHIAITGIDLPFGFDDFEKYIELENSYDLVFGSKAHPDSKSNTKLERRIASYLYRYLLLIFFGLPIRDPQGSIFFKKKKILKFLEYCDANNAFFTSQIAIHAKRKNLKMIEIPVRLFEQEKRKSKYKLFRDGKEMLLSLSREFYRIHFKKYNE